MGANKEIVNLVEQDIVEFSSDRVDANTQLVILQPTNFCNIDCKYCYLPDRKTYNLMQPQTIDRVAQAIFDSPYVSERFRIVWHAGEPLTAPISFYEDAIERFSRFNKNGAEIIWGIQTNGTLINQPWCDFFRKSNIEVGVSIDGPEEFHDRNRVDRRGRGTYTKVMRGIKLLQDNGIDFGILMVIDKFSMQSPEEIWKFFVENKISSIGFNPEEISGIHELSSLSYEQAADNMITFLRTLYSLRRLQRGYNPIIREIDDMSDRIKYARLPVSNEVSTPFAILNIDYLGNVSTFSPQLLGHLHPVYGDFRFGNVYRHRIEDMAKSPKFKRVYSDILKGISKCREICPYFDICGGGDPSAKLAEHGTFDAAETLDCKIDVKAGFHAVSAMLELELNIDR